MANVARTAVVFLGVLAACGGGGDDSPPDPAALASKIGCTDFEKSVGQIELGAREEAMCSLGEESITILTYSSNTPRDNANKIAEQFGGGIAVVGDRFTIRVDTSETAEKVKDAVGGEIR